MKSFLAVIDQGSLQAAGRSLGQSQPTIGRHVDQLESQLGVVLFERTGRALIPTETARQVAEAARTMQSSSDNICRLIQRKDQTLSGVVRITASRMITTAVMPQFALRLQQIAPDIELALVSTDVVSNLLKRDADIAIRMVKPSQADVIAKRIGDFPIRPCASQKYIDRWGAPKTTAELFNHRMVCPDKNSTELALINQFLEKHGKQADDMRLMFRTDDHVAQKAAIVSGVGIGFPIRFGTELDSGLIELPLDIPIPPLPVWLVVHREIRTTPRIRLVFDELAKQLKMYL